jgi:uncharacterized membrane protein YcjF (UPF0283 family)
LQIESADAVKLRKMLCAHVRYLHGIGATKNKVYDYLTEGFESDYDLPHWIEELREHLLKPMDDHAKKVIEENARAVAIYTALSPSETLDSFLVLWRSSRMIVDIASVYGMRPGWGGSLRLVFRVLAQVAAAAGTQASLNMLHVAYGPKIAQAMGSVLGLLGKSAKSAGGLVTLAGHPWLGLPIAVTGHFIASTAEKGGEVLEVLSGPVTDGLLMAVFTVRVGLATQNECRLISMTEEDIEKTAGIVGTIYGFLGGRGIHAKRDDDALPSGFAAQEPPDS